MPLQFSMTSACTSPSTLEAYEGVVDDEYEVGAAVYTGAEYVLELDVEDASDFDCANSPII